MSVHLYTNQNKVFKGVFHLLVLCFVLLCSCEKDKIKLDEKKKEKETKVSEKTPYFTFDKLSKIFKAGGLFTTAEILANVQGSDKMGYTLKEIKDISDGNVGIINGLNINFKKKGTFTATLVLEHTTKAAVTIKAAAFAIVGITIKDFHIPGLFVFDTIKKGADFSYEYELKFRADDGREELAVFKNTNGEQLKSKKISVLMPHKNGFVLSVDDDRKSTSEILITDNEFKIVKRISLGVENSIFNRSGSIINQKFYFTTSHFASKKNTYILDLNTHQLGKYNHLNVEKFLTDGNELYYLDFKRNLYRIKDLNNLDAGGTLVKDFKIDSSKDGWHTKERLENGYIDQDGNFWALKQVMKTAAPTFSIPSTYTLYIIRYNLKTNKTTTLNTGLITEAASLHFDPFGKKTYLVSKKDAYIGAMKIRTITHNGGKLQLGNVIHSLNGRHTYFRLSFTKNRQLFMQNEQELFKGNADFTGLKKIYTVGYLARFIYSNPQ